MQQGQADQTPAELDQLMRQPHAMWTRLRQQAPVHPVRGSDGERETFMVLGHDAVVSVLRDADTFSSAVNAETMGEVMGELMLAMDGKEHRDHRALVSKAFRASMLEKWEEELIRPTIVGLVERIAPLGRADLVRDVTTRYPVQVIAGIVGVPVDDYEQFQDWAEAIVSVAVEREAAIAASKKMADYLLPIIHSRRAEPTGDLISELVTAEIEGRRLTDERILGFLRLLLPAGAETTFRAMGNCLVALLTHPDALERVRRDRDLLPAVIEETLRWETSVTMVSRNATVDTEVAGCPIPAGSMLMVMTSSANRDEARCPRGEEWDLDRPPQNHVYFGTGRHQCLGMHLARLELRTGLSAVLDGLPDLRLDPEAPEPVVEGFAFRSPPSIPVVFTPSG